MILTYDEISGLPRDRATEDAIRFWGSPLMCVEHGCSKRADIWVQGYATLQGDILVCRDHGLELTGEVVSGLCKFRHEDRFRKEIIEIAKPSKTAAKK